MSESKFWWAFINDWGKVEYQYGTFIDAAVSASIDNIATVTRVEWYEDRVDNKLR